MTFIEAMLQLEKGKKVKMKDWPEDWYFYKEDDTTYREKHGYNFTSLDLHILLNGREIIQYCKKEWEVLEDA